jgi:hypothetical protein
MKINLNYRIIIYKNKKNLLKIIKNNLIKMILKKEIAKVEAEVEVRVEIDIIEKIVEKDIEIEGKFILLIYIRDNYNYKYYII